MKAVVILSVLLVGAFCASTIEKQLVRDIFNQWKLAHGKSYKAGHEEEHRFNVFLRNYVIIQTHNQKNKGVTLALNQFADLTSKEFAEKYTGLLQESGNDAQDTQMGLSQISYMQLPDSVDWRTKGAVSPIKNQLACGSCWAFATIGALEGYHFINKGELITFSEQQLVDCVTDCYGCNGGLRDLAMKYTAKNGVEKSSDYPYVAKNQKCTYDATKAISVNTGYTIVPVKSAVALKTALVAQPVSVGIQADQSVFQFYRSGVITKGCGDAINHGVLAVGYGTFDGIEAFIVKNSWGTVWGNQGYVLLSSDESQNNGNGVCGVLGRIYSPK